MLLTVWLDTSCEDDPNCASFVMNGGNCDANTDDQVCAPAAARKQRASASMYAQHSSLGGCSRTPQTTYPSNHQLYNSLSYTVKRFIGQKHTTQQQQHTLPIPSHTRPISSCTLPLPPNTFARIECEALC